MRRQLLTAIPSWVFIIFGCVLSVFFVGGERWAIGISISLGLSILISFFVQLILQEKDGLVNRLAFTTAGSLLVAAAGIVSAFAMNGIG